MTSQKQKKNDVIPNSFLENPNLISNVVFNNQPNQSSQFIFKNNSQNFNQNSNFNLNNQNRNSNFNFNSNQNINSNYNFNTPSQNNQKFNWKEIMKINPNDSNSFEPYINNLLNSSLNPNEIELLPENHIIQLVSLLQNVVKTSINNNNNLIEQNQNLNTQLKSSIQFQNQNNINNNLENENSDNEYNNLLKKNKKQEQLIQSYQQILEGNKKYNNQLIESDDDENEKNDSYNNSNKNRFYCQFCANKKFYTEQYLEDHMRRRHLAYYQKFLLNKNKNNNKNYDVKLNEMKNYFENMIVNNQLRNDYYRLNDKIKGLENLIQSQNYNTININQSNNLIPNQETIVLKNRNKNNNIIYEDTEEDDVNNSIIIEQMKKISNNIDKDDKDFNNKFNSLVENMNKFKKYVSNEISNIKQSQSFLRAKKSLESIDFNNDDIKYVSPNRRLSVRNSLFMSQTNPNQSNTLRNSIINVSQSKNLINSLLKQTKSNKLIESEVIKSIDNRITINNEKTILNNKNNEDNNLQETVKSNDNVNEILHDVKVNESIKIDDNLLRGGKNNINENEEEIEQTKEEKELQIFYKKFITRDRNYNGYLNSYILQTIPYSFEISNDRINNQYNNLFKENLNRISNSKLNKESDLEKIKSKDYLVDIIQKINDDIGNECEKEDYYGYYSKNLDNLFDLKEVIDDAMNDYYNHKENKRKINEDFDDKNLLQTINYNIKSSSDLDFSFHNQ